MEQTFPRAGTSSDVLEAQRLTDPRSEQAEVTPDEYKRFVLVDKRGLTGSKVAYHSIPYRSITHFSIETAGTFDLDAELKIWISGTSDPIQKQFNKKLSIYEVQGWIVTREWTSRYAPPHACDRQRSPWRCETRARRLSQSTF
jgi:hypothetical protein